jgi:hypothetical protein
VATIHERALLSIVLVVKLRQLGAWHLGGDLDLGTVRVWVFEVVMGGRLDPSPLVLSSLSARQREFLWLLLIRRMFLRLATHTGCYSYGLVEAVVSRCSAAGEIMWAGRTEAVAPHRGRHRAAAQPRCSTPLPRSALGCRRLWAPPVDVLHTAAAS